MTNMSVGVAGRPWYDSPVVEMVEIESERPVFQSSGGFELPDYEFDEDIDF